MHLCGGFTDVEVFYLGLLWEPAQYVSVGQGSTNNYVTRITNSYYKDNLQISFQKQWFSVHSKESFLCQSKGHSLSQLKILKNHSKSFEL